MVRRRGFSCIFASRFLAFFKSHFLLILGIPLFSTAIASCVPMDDALLGRIETVFAEEASIGCEEFL